MRFSLKALLILVTAIVLFCGYSQWRRQDILKECEYFKSQDIEIIVPNGWSDYIWQRRPSKALLITPSRHIYDEAMKVRLDKLGIKEIFWESAEVTSKPN